MPRILINKHGLFALGHRILIKTTRIIALGAQNPYQNKHGLLALGAQSPYKKNNYGLFAPVPNILIKKHGLFALGLSLLIQKTDYLHWGKEPLSNNSDYWDWGPEPL